VFQAIDDKLRLQSPSFPFSLKPLPRFAAADTWSCHFTAMQCLGYEFIEFVPSIPHSYVLMALCKWKFFNSKLKQRFYLDFLIKKHYVYVKIFVQLQVVEKGIRRYDCFNKQLNAQILLFYNNMYVTLQSPKCCEH
jgi:hypothetical protein